MQTYYYIMFYYRINFLNDRYCLNCFTKAIELIISYTIASVNKHSLVYCKWMVTKRGLTVKKNLSCHMLQIEE